VVNTTEPKNVTFVRFAGPPKELLSSSAFLLKRVGYAAKERTHDAFEGTGLSPFHYAVLALLEEDARETQAAIADALGYDRSHIVRLLDELEERNLVMRKRDPDDRRRHVVKMTPEGKKMLAKLRAIMREIEEEFLAPLDAGERAALQALLSRLAAHHDPRCTPREPAAPAS
jgi:MarR family transcriptional regulator, lower aerobic nicotinate degradation pathway regulator